jgi:hypothetical protein
MVSARVSILVAAAVLLGSAAADAACAPGQTRDCVINLGVVPQISQQIVARDQAAPVAKTATGASTDTPYTGPTVGLTPTPRRFPTLGYHWSFD